ncbi:molybdenum ABC transporter ATP-binding protein [Rhizobium leguminosarum]|jgi:molybdate transport system ATP-binding protein|uniref:Molybdenum ABC transporter ATP-binding protein n=2 Tax=Rhizobium leguminosarum TaxID=384 RepID=A0A1B8RCU3_RHILT|nr:molybdenum ABC transporter ATP-binding protein [Rhizobium leguminosarum]AOO90640.1 molybdenum ABC transporter ATP-binding protein [Rhizobium leguminosarum bv. trifolii]AXA40505.1 molybdate ABC transporter, ATP-binding protein [Rhizobium leguminosarum]MBY5467643.1 molybdenum ABC transporter ATP-binding protein [Rhizobium leguminosarum]MBY5913987.1 molybdenum ABC transporter ATP-binding protein [Rhizobium leguminosarum]MDH6272066.1 molybdate transport system ATP-binding protein [Rhizobium leg
MTLIVEAKQRLGAFSLDAAFTSERGVTALFGRSGSGKTSMIRIIAGLARPDEGRVVLDGEPLTETATGIFVPKHRRRFGYVFQEARLFPHLSIRANLSYGRWFAARPAHGESFDHIVDLLGIETLLERSPAKLSGGEKQRVAIGRALLSSPRLLLMDEPLAALDDARKAEILPYLQRLRDETDIPIVYVSHSIAEVARLANQVVVMRDGKVEATGPAIDILSRPSAASERREAGALLEGTVESFDALHRLSTIALKSCQLHIPGAALAPGKSVRIRIPSRDVMLATARPEGLSALNILEARIEAMSSTEDGTVEIRLDCGGDIILSRITTLSCERLDLRLGRAVFAVIKTVALEA